MNNNSNVEVVTNKFKFKTNKLLFSQTGFASQLTKQIKTNMELSGAELLRWNKGTFHLDKGYYYFRNMEIEFFWRWKKLRL
jgi:hypothetical protein